MFTKVNMSKREVRSMTTEKRSTPAARPQHAKDDMRRYPQGMQEYEKLMQHDAFRRVKGRVRQTRWADTR